MKLNITTAAVLIALATGSAFADGHTGQGFSMLQTALMSELERIGIDPTTMGDDLTLGQVATIKSIVDSDDNDSQKKGRIEAIIANN
ncbi:hypothetical protein SAMN05444004_11992 [Jannaschia faecimaris]|uniref:Uncharacterized protein n=1 Tax=Jannaschia faecimaris TaxID=1244108 RepID=A0A1H3TTV0_9RHOB|nr:hypothetical protein [Jannaschia faecimaris]SDZ53576.1 hypothetical protein SAMN05444004_11992 [Jannaschia faecimaris]